jgi:hypothetical protein
MRRTYMPLAVIAALLAAVTPSPAQTISVYDTNGPRLGGSVSYGGHGVDWEMSLDSRAFWNRVHFRALVGQGRWVEGVATLPPAGNDPTVTRAGFAVIRTGPFDAYAPVRVYGGAGLSALIPRGVPMDTVVGVHALIGIEAVGDRWSFGPEVQIDLPARTHNLYSLDRPGSYLYPTARIGVFARRRL